MNPASRSISSVSYRTLNLVVSAVILCYALLAGWMIARGGLTSPVGADFRAFLASARIASTAGYAAVYDLRLQKEAQEALARPYTAGPVEVLPTFFLPAFVAPFSLFLPFPFPIGLVIWTLLNLGALLLLVLDFVDQKRDNLRWFWIMLASFPVFSNLPRGQINIWLLWCIAAFLKKWEQEKPFVGGLWLGILLIKPQTLVLLIPALALSREWKVLAGFGVTALILLLASFALAGAGGMRAWLLLPFHYKGRPFLAGLCLGSGIAAKLYPVVLLPGLALYAWAQDAKRQVPRFLLGTVIAVVLPLLPFAIFQPRLLLSFWTYHSQRGLEIESLYAGWIALLHRIGLVDARPTLQYGTWDLASPLADLAVRGQPWIFLAVYGGYLWNTWQKFRRAQRNQGHIGIEGLMASLLNGLMVFILTNKVFSPQYILWLLPFGAFLRGRHLRVFLLIILLTVVNFPFLFDHLTRLEWGPVLIVNLRNTLMLLATLWLFRNTASNAPLTKQPSHPCGQEPANHLPRRLSRWLTAFHVGVALGYLALWIKAALDGLLWRADLTAFYTGGAIVCQGLGPRLYDLALQTRVQQAILGPGRMFYDGVLPFNNPPHFALVMAPFSLLPPGVAYWLWAALQILLLALVLRRLTGMVSHWSRTDRWLLLSAFFAWFPLFLNMLYGSLSLFLLLCWLEFYRALRRGDDVGSGIWLALAAVKPQGALFLALVLLGGRRWRALVSAGIAGAAIVGVTAVALGPSIWPDYLRWLAATSGYFDRLGVYPEGMMNLKGTLTLLLGVERAPLIQTLTTLALLIGSLGTLILWLRTRWEPGTTPFDLRLAWTLVLGALLSPHQNQQDCLTLLLPVLLFCDAQCRMGRPARPMALFLLSWPILFLVEEFALRGALHIRVPVILMVILLIWTWRLWHAEEKARFPAGAGSF